MQEHFYKLPLSSVLQILLTAHFTVINHSFHLDECHLFMCYWGHGHLWGDKHNHCPQIAIQGLQFWFAGGQILFTEMLLKSKKNNFTPQTSKSCRWKSADQSITHLAVSVFSLGDPAFNIVSSQSHTVWQKTWHITIKGILNVFFILHLTHNTVDAKCFRVPR